MEKKGLGQNFRPDKYLLALPAVQTEFGPRKERGACAHKIVSYSPRK